MNSAKLIYCNLRGVSKYNARGADGGKRLAVLNNAGADSRSRIVARAADNYCAFAQTNLFGDFLCQTAGNLAGFVNLAQHVLVESQCFDNLIRPVSFGDV